MKYNKDEKRCIRVIAKWFRDNRNFVGRDDLTKELGVDDNKCDTLIKMMEHLGAIEDVKSVMGENGYGIFFRPSAYAEELAREIDITVSEKYVSVSLRGKVTFDYSNNNGNYIIGTGDLAFETSWSKASDTAIHTSNDRPSIAGIGLVLCRI